MSTGIATAIQDEPEEAVADYFAGLTDGQQQVIEGYQDCDELDQIQKDVLKNVDYKVTEALQKGQVAVAKVTISNRDYSGVNDAYKKEAYDYIMDNLYSEDVTDKSRLKEKCLEIYADKVREASDSDSKTKAEVYIPMVQNQDNGWDVILSSKARKAIMGNMDLPSDDDEKNDTAKADAGDLLRQEAVDKVLDKESIPAYSFAEVQAMDMSKPSGVTVEDLKLVTREKLVGTEEKLYEMEQNYNLNCLFLLGIASHESAYGTMQFHPNNVCGYGYSGFPSINDCLDTVGRVLAKNYLDPSGPFYKGNTIDSVNKTYAADPAWDSKVANKVTYFYQVISENHNKQLNKLKD